MKYSGFKKIHEDEKKAVLKNEKGHSITIAKDALSKNHLEQLKGLELHAADGMEIPEEGLVPDRQPAMSAMPSQNVQASMQQDAVQIRQQAKKQYELEHAKEFGAQDAAWAQDLANGHVQPQTYADLFAKKDTLGKIGTIFGIMLSGAGSGLAHQPNAALELMNKQIENDLNAQKSSKEGARNYLQLNQQNELNKANIGLMGEQKKGVSVENQIKSQTLAKNQMLLATLHHLQNQTDKLPPGPNKVQAMQTLDGVKQAAGQQMANNILNSSKQLAAQKEEQYVSDTSDYRKMGMLGQEGAEQMAKTREDHYIPGVGTSTIPLGGDDRKRITSITNFQNLLKEAEDFDKQLGKRASLGALTPSEKANAERIHNDLISSYNDVKGLNRFTKNEENLYADIVPYIGKRNLTGAQRDQLERVKSSVQTKKDLEMKSLGIKSFEEEKPKEKSNASEGATGTYNGKPVVFKNGKWSYK